MQQPELLSMVAFDLETMGLDPKVHPITAASICNGYGFEKVYVFKGESVEEDLALRDEFMQYLDNAPSLCAFNGVKFDIPFMAKAWNLPLERVTGWILKTIDVFQICKLGIDQTFSLSKLLAANNLPCKTGSGLEAIQLAKDKKWEELGAYCAMDTKLTYQVTAQRVIALPVNWGQKNLVLDHSYPTLFQAW